MCFKYKIQYFVFVFKSLFGGVFRVLKDTKYCASFFESYNFFLFFDMFCELRDNLFV